MKQCVSRRRRCWTFLVQMDPVIHLSEGHRCDILLDLSGLTREERVMVQASISDERDFERVADALIIQHPRIHLRESQRRTKGKGKDGFKRGDNSNTRWFFGKGKGKHTGSGQSGASAYYANFTSIEDHDYDDDLEVMMGKKLWTTNMMKKTIHVLRMLLWIILLFSRQLNWMRLLFLSTRGTTILTLT